MKKVLLSCDEYVFSYNGKYYVREFGEVLFSRYLNVFDDLRLAVRVKEVGSYEDLEKFNIPLPDKNIEVFPLPFFQGVWQNAQVYFQSKRTMKDVAAGCQAAIFRLPSMAALACLNSVKNQNIPYAVELVANPHEVVKNSSDIIFRVIWSIMHLKQKSICKNANGVSYVTEKTLQKVYPTSKSAFQTYYSSIALDDSFFYNQRTLDLKLSEIIISHIASDIKTFTKGHITVIEVVKELKDQGFEVKARFAGEGEFVALFKRKAEELGIQEYIEFVGPLDNKQIKQFLLDSNIMVFPSSSEGLPRVLIEAMATGLPCLSTPVGGVPEILAEDYLFDSVDVNGFTQKVIEIFSDKLLYEAISQQNFNKSLEFKNEVLEKRRNKFYTNLKKITVDF